MKQVYELNYSFDILNLIPIAVIMKSKKSTFNFSLLTPDDLKVIAIAELALGKAMKQTLLQDSYDHFPDAVEKQLTKKDTEYVEAAFLLLAEKIIEVNLTPEAERPFLKFHKKSAFNFLNQYSKLIHLQEVVDFIKDITEKETSQGLSLNLIIDRRIPARMVNKPYSLN